MSRTVDATIDTGATNTTLDRRLVDEVGIAAVNCQEVALANGSTDTVRVGSADIEVAGVRRVVPIFIYDSNLIGPTTFEAAGLRVNTVSRQLEKAPVKLLGIRARRPA